MSFRYSALGRKARILYRSFLPVPRSPWTQGHVADICDVNLVPPERLISFFEECLWFLNQVKGPGPVGDYLEFGVFNGSSMGSMHIARKRAREKGMRLFGFDAFEGLPPGSEHEDGGAWQKGDYTCSFDQTCECLRRRSVDPGDVTWVNGWYNQTLTPELARKHDLGNLGIVFIDCDTYTSAKTVLDFIAPLIKRPVIICLDDWKLNDLDVKGMGEYQAFNEFLEENPHLEAVSRRSYNRKSRTFLVRLK